MSEETKIKLIRQDKEKNLDSYNNIYDIEPLSSLSENEKSNILKIIKKTILGCNFTYFDLLNNLFYEYLSSFLIITSMIIFIFSSYDASYSNKVLIIFLTIINFIIHFIIFIINSNHKKKTIYNYMQKTTQCAIKEENDILIKNKLFCEISKNNFALEIESKEKPFDLKLNNEEIFFQYSINFINPNGRNIPIVLYNKAFTDKENEIIKNINSILKEILSKYSNKSIAYAIIVAIIFIVCFIFCCYKSVETTIQIINIIATLFMTVFILYFFSFQRKKEDFKSVSSLNEKYIKDGYYIYINDDIVSIFLLKEKYRINGDIRLIKEMNEKLMKIIC